MKTIKELNPRNFPIDSEIESNLNELFGKLINLQIAYGKDFIITSGLRSQEFQDGLIKSGVSKASKSKHILGQAVDIKDDGKLKAWIKANISVMESLGLWMEDFSATPTWVHMQIVPPRSGKRFFMP